MIPIIAITILLIGPASATSSSSLRGFLKYLGSIGTGFPRPNPIRKINKNPIGSMCLRGFGVNLPKFFAVGSHNSKLAHA